MRRTPNRTVWERIKEALKDARLPDTQTYAARLLGIEQPSVSAWNNEDNYPKLEHAVELAERLNVCVEWLYTERGPKRPTPQDDLAQRIWDVWPLLSDAVKGELVGIAAAKAQPHSRDPYPKRA